MKKILYIIGGLLIAGIITIIVMIVIKDQKTQNDYENWARKENSQQIAEVSEERVEKREEQAVQKEADDSFYQKLMDGYDVNILILGDSYAHGKGTGVIDKTWSELLKENLESSYDVTVNIDDLSLENSVVYSGYAQIMKNQWPSEGGIEYDAAIISYGYQDDPEMFATYYEAVLRQLHNIYKKCSVISIIESASTVVPTLYADDNKPAIEEITSHYGGYCVDMGEAYVREGLAVDYGQDTSPSVQHLPDNAGQELYASEIEELIRTHADEREEYTVTDVEPVNEAVLCFDNCYYLPVDDFVREDDWYYTISADKLIDEGGYRLDSLYGLLSVDVDFLSGANEIDVLTDGETFGQIRAMISSDNPQPLIEVVGNNFSCNDELRIRFTGPQQADSFRGVMLSGNIALPGREIRENATPSETESVIPEATVLPEAESAIPEADTLPEAESVIPE